MDDRMTDLLTEAADDGDRPLRFTPADLTGRGRRLRRRRAGLVAAGGAVAATAAAAVALSLTGGSGGPRAVDPADPVAPTSETSTDTSGAPALEPTGEDAQVLDQCRRAGPDLAGWVLDAQVSDDYGTTATLVSSDGASWRECSLVAPGVRGGDRVSESWPLDTTAIPDPWEVPDSGIEYADECPKEATTCSAVLYDGVFPLRDGVTSISVETPQGDRIDAATGTVTYVVRFAEERVPEPLPAVVATLRDADGDVVIRYDYNDLMR